MYSPRRVALYPKWFYVFVYRGLNSCEGNVYDYWCICIYLIIHIIELFSRLKYYWLSCWSVSHIYIYMHCWIVVVVVMLTLCCSELYVDIHSWVHFILIPCWGLMPWNVYHSTVEGLCPGTPCRSIVEGSCLVNALTIQNVEGSCPGTPCRSIVEGSCPVNALTIQNVEGSCPGMHCHSNTLMVPHACALSHFVVESCWCCHVIAWVVVVGWVVGGLLDELKIYC